MVKKATAPRVLPFFAIFQSIDSVAAIIITTTITTKAEEKILLHLFFSYCFVSFHSLSIDSVILLFFAFFIAKSAYIL